MIMNIDSPYQTPANLFKLFAHPARLAILSILRDGEQCVCHMEATLGLRQAYISQQLKVLREAGIVANRREGWNNYYRVIKPEVFTVIDAVTSITGTPSPQTQIMDDCQCPKCHIERDGLPVAGEWRLPKKITG